MAKTRLSISNSAPPTNNWSILPSPYNHTLKSRSNTRRAATHPVRLVLQHPHKQPPEFPLGKRKTPVRIGSPLPLLTGVFPCPKSYCSPRQNQFFPRPIEARPYTSSALSHKRLFQPTSLRKARPALTTRCIQVGKFQSTGLCKARLCLHFHLAGALGISIHGPTQGPTLRIGF